MNRLIAEVVADVPVSLDCVITKFNGCSTVPVTLTLYKLA